MATPLTRRLFTTLVEKAETDGGLSVDERESEPGNFLRHVAVLSMTKLADGLLNPKLVLSWLLAHLGAGAFWIGFLVPVREAGALLPQLFTAGAIHGIARRKWVWAIGSAVQGLAALGIALTALSISGSVAGAVIVALLAVLALSRSASSVSYKDVLGKTVGQSRRGTASGTAGTLAAGGVIAYALILMTGVADRYVLVVGGLCLAALLWGLAGATMARMVETAAPGEALTVRQSVGQLKLLWQRPQLARFVIARSALVGTALAPPFLVLLASEDGPTAQLGALVLASSIAEFLSAFFWGRLSDRSSRKVLMLSGLAAALALGLALMLAWAGLAASLWAVPLCLFLLMIAYHGVRTARATYLVDMAPRGDRPAYTAVSNTVVGVVLLFAGAGAASLAAWSVPLALGVFLMMSVVGAWIAYGLEEVEDG